MDFENVKAAFWNEAVDLDLQARLTDALVAHAERTLGVTPTVIGRGGCPARYGSAKKIYARFELA